MGRYGTKYHEDERELDQLRISRFGLNPFAADILIKSYKQNVAPQPANIIYQVNLSKADEKMDAKAKSKRRVEISLLTPGFVGPYTGLPKKGLDKFGLKLFARSYYENLRPQHISFIYQGVEVHIRTPGIGESEKKNVARNIYNPTI